MARNRFSGEGVDLFWHEALVDDLNGARAREQLGETIEHTGVFTRHAFLAGHIGPGGRDEQNLGHLAKRGRFEARPRAARARHGAPARACSEARRKAAALIANTKNGSPRNEGDLKKVLALAWENLDEIFKGEERLGQDPETGRATGLPCARQLAEKTGVSKAWCAKFIKLMRASTVDATSDKNADATKVTHEHTEVRNPKVRANLKEGLGRFGQAIPENLLGALKSRLVGQFRKQLANGRKALKEAGMGA